MGGSLFASCGFGVMILRKHEWQQRKQQLIFLLHATL